MNDVKDAASDNVEAGGPQTLETPEQIAAQEKAADLRQLAEMEKACEDIRARHGIALPFSFPDIGENIGGHHVEQAKNIFWIGIKVTQFDYMGAIAFLESYKFQLWMVYRDMAQQIAIRKALSEKPKGPAGAAGALKNLVTKLGLGR